jgi:hypothetical protein
MAFQFDLYVKLSFERGLIWFVGRRPVVERPSLSLESIIPIHNPAITSYVGKITSVATNYGDIHLFKVFKDIKQPVTVNGKEIAQDHVFRDGDALRISHLPLEITYRVVEEKLEKSEDDTLGFNYDETDAIA